MDNIQEKIKAINEIEKIEDLPAKYWPISFNEKYLFISYSHLDYKEVFKDLLLFNEMQVNIWYDRSLRPSNNWELDAEQYMANYNCVGVVFYLSERSLRSASVYKEITKAKQRKIPYVAILLTDVDKSVLDLYRALPEENKSDLRENLLKEVFNDNIIYLNIHQDISQRLDKMENLFKEKPLYNYAVSRKRSNSNDPEYKPLSPAFRRESQIKYNIEIQDEFAALISINNIDLMHADDLAEFVELDGKHYPLAKIDSCAFANCTKLNTITFPSTLQIVKNNAFCNCQSLEQAILPEGVVILKSSVFAGCIGLKKVYLPDTLKEIRSWCFAGCHSLKEIFIPKSVEVMEEFVFDGLENILVLCEADAPQPKWDKRFCNGVKKIVYGARRPTTE